MRPTEKELNMLGDLLEYSERYELSIQFWPNQTAVYIAKGMTELQSFGGSFEYAISEAKKFLDRITKRGEDIVSAGEEKDNIVWFICDSCGNKKKSFRWPVYDEQWNKVDGLQQCNECMLDFSDQHLKVKSVIREKKKK